MRYEKALAALPVKPCPALKQKSEERIDKYKTIEYIRYSAEIVNMKVEEVLAVTTYGADGSAKYRFFLLNDQYGMQVFEKEKYVWHKERLPGKIYGAAMDSIYQELSKTWWSNKKLCMYATAASKDAVYRFFRKKKTDGDPIRLLIDRQAEIREEKINARDDRERERLREAFAGVSKEIPKEFEVYAEEVPLRDHRFFFYEYTGQKEQIGICSHCGKDAALPGIKERQKGVCPHCGTTFTFYSAKRFFNTYGLVERRRAAFFQIVNENRIVLRCCEVGISLRGGNRGKVEKIVWANEDIRIFMDGSGREIERYEAPTGTKKVYLDNLARSEAHCTVVESWIAPMKLETLRKRMRIYTPLEVLADRGLQCNPDRLFIIARERPEIEYLVKMGLHKMAVYELNVYKNGSGKYAGSVLLDGKNAVERLGVPPDVIPMLKEADPSARAFLVIRSLLKWRMSLTTRDMQDITRLRIRSSTSDQLYNMAKECSIHKALKYISRQAEIFKSDGDHVLQQWGDYLGMARELRINLGDHCAVMPKNLKAAHEEAVKLIDFKKNEKLNKQMKATGDKLQDLCWEFGGLTIRPAVSQAELFNEGQALSHCVGRMNYAEKMAKGETAIFFIRKKAAPDESYVTLELSLKRWEKIQCYGKHDTYPGTKVNQFVKQWIQEVVKPSRPESSTANADKAKITA